MSDTRREPWLLTPGPLTTSDTTKRAMMRDWGSRDVEFIEMGRRVRERLLEIADAQQTHVCVCMQGSGTFSIEAMLGTLLPRDGKLLVLVNGAYGRRLVRICEILGRECVSLESDEREPPSSTRLDEMLTQDSAITHVAVVHCETTSGLLNPVAEVAEIVKSHGRSLLVDAMSSFGAVEIKASEVPFDALVSSTNKCLEGVPGMGYVLVRQEALEACQGNAHSLSLDLYEQWRYTEGNGQWRFTPPTHVIAAFQQALEEHRREGGVAGRGRRYRENCRILVDGMRAMGFETYLPDDLQAPIIVTFRPPDSPNWDFSTFYDKLRERGYAIYPGKLTQEDSFRIGCIGRLGAAEMRGALDAIEGVLDEMNVRERSSADRLEPIHPPRSVELPKPAAYDEGPEHFTYSRSYRGKLKAVILDWAGTVLDFGCMAPAVVFMDVFEREGVPISLQEARVPMGAHKRVHIQRISRLESVAERWLEVHGKPCTEDDVDRMFAAFVPLQLACLGDYAELIPGMLDVATELRRRGMKVGSTSGYTREMMELLLREAERRGYVPDASVCATEVPAGRPYPFMCLQNVLDLGVSPVTACVKVDDTIPGIDEGLNAGMWTVGLAVSGNEVGLPLDDYLALDPMLRDMKRERAYLRMQRSGAHFVIDSIADLIPCLDEIETRLARGEQP